MRSEIYKTDLVVQTKSHTRLATDDNSLLWQSQWKLLRLGSLCMDIVMIVVGFLLAYIVRFNLSIPFFYIHEDNILLGYYLMIAALLLPFWIFTFRLYGLYSVKENLSSINICAKLFSATTIPMFVLIVVDFFFPEIIVARGWLLLMWAFVYILTVIGRFFLQGMVNHFRIKGFFLTPALIVGANEEARLLARQFRNERISGLKLVGFVADDIKVGTALFSDLRVLGPLSELDRLVHEMNLEEVIVTTSAVSAGDVLNIFKMYGIKDGVTLRLSSGLYDIITTGLQIQELSSVPLVKVNEFRLTGINHFLKFILDYSFSLLAMIFVVPLCIVIGILIKIDSKGPVFHRRLVMGVKGKEFHAFKFRTMYINGDEILEAYPALKRRLEEEHKLKDDPRITRVGRMIRKLSLDEFPQFFNVLRGEMSVVGPRMISPGEMQEYQQNGMNLLTLRPGITGLWQVSGRSDVTYQERVQLDMNYIRNWSIWMDFQLIFRTIPALISRRGAY